MKGLRARILQAAPSRVLQAISVNALSLLPPPPPAEHDALAGGGGEAERSSGKDDEANGKENFAAAREGEDGSSQYRRPDLNSPSLFDPDLLAAFRRAVAEYQERRRRCADSDSWPAFENEGGGEEEEDEEEERPCKMRRRIDGGQQEEEEEMRLERRCPPGGGGGAVLYTTSLRGIRKTFEDCNRVRALLSSLRVAFDERDVSMHLDYREELRRTLGGAAERAVPPRLFVKGMLVGGADDVLGLHERGRLVPLLRGVPVDRTGGAPCAWCGGARFVLCEECSGSCKVVADGGGGGATRCPNCNENGLVVCALCRSRAVPPPDGGDAE